MSALRLGVNVDHVATIRNARGGAVPDPVRAALMAIEAGADGITAHLREDRRHIHDDDVRRLKASIKKPLNFSRWRRPRPACSTLRSRSIRTPAASCRKSAPSSTTEGGLDVVNGFKDLKPFVAELAREGIRVSMFIEPSPEALNTQAPNSGRRWSSCARGRGATRARGDAAKGDQNLAAQRLAAAQTETLGLECHADHGLDCETACVISTLPQIARLNIGRLHRRGDFRRPRRSGESDAHGDGGGTRGLGAPALIIGIGSDLCEIVRIERTLARHGERFVARCFTETEQRKSDGRTARAASYAKRFAAKEACAKALGAPG